MTAERLEKKCEQIAITAEWLKIFSNDRPEQLNSFISKKYFEWMVLNS